MKHLITVLLLSSLCSNLIAQLNNFYEINGWLIPKPTHEFVKQFQVRALHIQTTGTAPSRGGGLTELASGKILYFNQEGNTIKEMEIHEQDTTFIKEWIYTENGLPRWEYAQDRIWNKEYRTAYRFNRDETIFQIKSYEMLGKEEMMLVDTQHYIYGRDNLHTIRSLSRDEMQEEHHFLHGEDGRLYREEFIDKSGQVIRYIAYEYDALGRLISTKEKNISSFSDELHEYIYQYKNDGKISQVAWKENGVLRGTGTYQYDVMGKLIRIERIMHGTTESEEIAELISFSYKNF